MNVCAVKVSADTITAKSCENFIIPVEIYGNSGIMGFKINVKYDASVLSSPLVHRGKITNQGLLNDSIGVSDEGSFDVLWSNTENVLGDGTLFLLSFKINETKADKTVIKLSCSQPDTFNEAWEDVTLDLKEIEVNIVSEPFSEKSSEGYKEDAGVDTEDIKSAVEIALGELEKNNTNGMNDSEKTQLVDRTNEIIFQLSGSKNAFSDFDSLNSAYRDSVEQEYVKDTLSAVDSDEIDSAINIALDRFDKETIEELEPDEKAEFVKIVDNELKQLAGDFDTISDKLSAEDALSAIGRLQRENKEAMTDGKKVFEPMVKNNTVVTAITVACLATVILAVLITVLYRKKKCGGNIK
ncbi:MAG: hypothetical protein IKB93_06555 [Clostridia bacterium]|nr:hypothetical protein [Clostridia bacterium]